MNETRKESSSDNVTRKESDVPDRTRREVNNSALNTSQSSGQYHDLLVPILPPGYSVLKLLSSAGGESDVFLIAKGPDKEVLKLYRSGVDIKESTLQEMKAISEKYPEHLIKIFDIGYNSELGRWFERMEYASYGNLREFFPYGYAGKKLVDAVYEEIKLALEVLHENNLVHRDLKPENIMVRSKQPLDLIFADFGMSSSMDNSMSRKMTMTEGGTPDYMAPESFMSMDGQTITGRGVDLWAFGIILYEMITGQTPFAGINPMMIGHKLITEEVVMDEEEIPVEFHEDYLFPLKQLLNKDPKVRDFSKLPEEQIMKIKETLDTNQKKIKQNISHKLPEEIQEIIDYSLSLDHEVYTNNNDEPWCVLKDKLRNNLNKIKELSEKGSSPSQYLLGLYCDYDMAVDFDPNEDWDSFEARTNKNEDIAKSSGYAPAIKWLEEMDWVI